MQVEIFHVHIKPTGGFSRQWWVPEYDIPILRAAWPKADIDVNRTGRIEDRHPDNEIRRMSIEYAGAVEGDPLPLFQRIYPSNIQFMEAFNRAEYRRDTMPPEVRAQIEFERKQQATAVTSVPAVHSVAPARPARPAHPEPAASLPFDDEPDADAKLPTEISAADCPEIKDEWLPAFVTAGLDTVDALADAEASAIDALPVRGLGKATSAKIVAWARAVRSARNLAGLGAR